MVSYAVFFSSFVLVPRFMVLASSYRVIWIDIFDGYFVGLKFAVSRIRVPFCGI
jgi:hypothetical protein